MTFLNVATGKKYTSVSRTSFQHYLGPEDYANIFKIKYREIFREAKNDMLATAMQKSHVAHLITPVKSAPGPAPVAEKPKSIPPEKVASVPSRPSSAPSSSQIARPPVQEKPLAASPKEIKEAKALPAHSVTEQPKSTDAGKVPSVPAPPTPAPPPKQISTPVVKEEPLPKVSKEMEEAPEGLAGVPVLDMEKILTAETKPDSRKRLAVYDLETAEPLKVVGLILSEALREELIRLGHFALVNRENLVQVLKEIELQMTGLVDEKQAVKVGKGLAANQIVMGRYGALGKTAVLQAKRVDVESQGTLAMASLKCSQGQEDELLGQMAELARRLAGGK